MISKLIIQVICALLLACNALAGPKVFFSDMQDGVASGFNGSTTQGAAISIWGLDFGTTRGSGYVSVGGVNLTNDASYAEWGATTNPTTARGLQRITFYLNSSMTKDGTAPNTSIVVTTADGSSTAIPFHVRSTGSIYFVSPTGSDTADGLTISTPWKTGEKIRSSLSAGDVAYLRAGVYTDPDTAYSASRATWIQIWGNNIATGTAWNSIGVSSYPGEMAQIGDGSCYSDVNQKIKLVIERLLSGSTGKAWNYWTFSKLKTLTSTGVISEGNSSPNFSDIGLRFVGLDVRTTSATSGTGIPFTKEGGGGSSYFYLLGNYFHHTGVPLAPATPPTLSSGVATGLTGQYSAKYTYAEINGSNQVMQESEMSVAGSPVTLSNGSVRITWTAPPADHVPAYTHVRIYRTKAGGTTYFYEKSVAIAAGNTDLNTADASLSTRTDIDGGYYVGPMYFGGYGSLHHIYVGWNEMYKNNGTAIQNYGHVATDTCSHLYFHDNYIHDSSTCAWNGRPSIITGGGDGGANYTYASNIYIYNNVIARNGGPGIRVDGMTSGGGGTYYIYNNTFYGNATLDGENFEIGGSADTTLLFRNNIVYTTRGSMYNTAYYGSPQNSVLGLSGDHNLWYGLGAGPTWSSNDLDNTNPQFVSTTDFRLQAASPAIGTGSDDVTISSPDFAGIIRGSVFDIGAYEYVVRGGRLSGSLSGGGVMR